MHLLPFILKTDLSTSEAESTLHYLEEFLASLRTETSLQIISEKMSAAVNQRAVKIIAYRNGAGYRNGQLIVANTFPMVSSNPLEIILTELTWTSSRYQIMGKNLIPTARERGQIGCVVCGGKWLTHPRLALLL